MKWFKNTVYNFVARSYDIFECFCTCSRSTNDGYSDFCRLVLILIVHNGFSAMNRSKKLIPHLTRVFSPSPRAKHSIGDWGSAVDGVALWKKE